MSDPKDVIDKADAFLGRYRPATAAEELPVLTDVVELPAAGADAARRLANPPSIPGNVDLRAIERQVTQRVLATIQPSLSGFPEDPLHATLQSRLEHALGPLTEQFKADIETIVREAVATAVEREVTRLRQQSGVDTPKKSQ